MPIRQFDVLFIVLLFQLVSCQYYPWEGECGMTVPPHTVVCIDHGHGPVGPNGACPEDVPQLHPWHTALLGPHSSTTAAMYGFATLIRARAHYEESDIVITSRKACTHYCSGGIAYFGMYSGNEEAEFNAPVAGCYMPLDRFDNEICVIKLTQTVTFTETTKPACVEASNAQVQQGSQGFILAWDAASLQVLEVPRKVVTQANIAGFSIETAEDGKPVPIWGSPFFTKSIDHGRQPGRYVMHGVYMHDMTVLQLRTHMFGRLSTYIQNGWLESIIRNQSALWNQYVRWI